MTKKLTAQNLLDHAIKLKEKGVAIVDVNNPETWLAATCATQLSGKEHVMMDFEYFYEDEGTTYDSVPSEYGEFCDAKANSESELVEIDELISFLKTIV